MNKYEELLNAVRTNCGTHSEYYKTVKELVDQTKTPTLEEVKEEVKKEWEDEGFIWEETERNIYICEVNGNVAITFNKINEYFCSNLFINNKRLKLLTKTFRALGWEV